MQPPATLVLGASPNPWRYAHMAVARLLAHGYRVVAVGRRQGDASGVPILSELPPGMSFDTVTIYLNATNQIPWEQQLLDRAPRRIIFNPGAENLVLAGKAEAAGIKVVEGCTLVMLAAGTY